MIDIILIDFGRRSELDYSSYCCENAVKSALKIILAKCLNRRHCSTSKLGEEDSSALVMAEVRNVKQNKVRESISLGAWNRMYYARSELPPDFWGCMKSFLCNILWGLT
jgi:hypothetical protein